MAVILVCPSALAGAVAARRAPSHVVGIASPGDPIPTVPGAESLALAFHDIEAPSADLVAPTGRDLADLLAFAERWDGSAPLLVHCALGISRSPAAAFAVACAHRPEQTEADLAASLRVAAPCATPNSRIVALADAALGRDGRMVAAIRAIGRGADYRRQPGFALALE